MFADLWQEHKAKIVAIGLVLIAIFSSVSPRNSRWSIDTGMMTLASALSITLVASSRPPSPTSSSSTSAGWRENSRKAAAVSISNTVIGAPPLARSHSSSAAASASSDTSTPPPGAPSRNRSLKRTRCGEV